MDTLSLNDKTLLHAPRNQSDLDVASVMAILGDFGTVRVLSEGSQVNTTVGSQFYMSPEVLYGETYRTDADIWSLGVSIYQLVTGKCKPIALMVFKRESKTIREDLEVALMDDELSEADRIEVKEFIDLLMQMFCADINSRLDLDAILSSNSLKPYLDRVLLAISQYECQLITEQNQKLSKLVEDLKISLMSNQGVNTSFRMATTMKGSQLLTSTTSQTRLLLISSWWSSNFRIYPFSENSPVDLTGMPYLLDLKSDLTCEQILALSQQEVIVGLESGELTKMRREGEHSFKEVLRVSAHKDRVKCLKLFDGPNSNNSLDLFASGSYNRSVKIFKRSTLECVQSYQHESGNIFCLATSTITKRKPILYSVGSDMSIYEWDLEQCIQVRTNAHSNEIYSAIFSDVNGILMTGSNKEMKGWDTRAYNPAFFIQQAHSNFINKIVMVGPSENIFATCSNDGYIKLWDLRKLQSFTSTEPLKSFKVNLDGIKCLTTYCAPNLLDPSKNDLSEDNGFIIYGTKRGRIGVLDIKTFSLVKSYNVIKVS